MATFYKYQERDPSSQINWAEVGANFSGMLMAEKETRENKKQAIDDATREQQRVIDNAVQGDSANMNQWTLDYAAEATEQLQMANRLLKSGSLSMKEYTMMRQNTSDGTDQAFTLAQEYQTEYADKMARANCKDPEKVGCSQQLETWLMASAEGFGNFSKSRLVIDPQSGKVMVGFYRENEEGVMELDSNPNKLVGINNLRNRIKSKADLYDMDGEVVKAAKSFGEYEEVTRTIGSLYKKGQITITSDVTLRNKEIEKAVKDGKLTQEEADELNRISPGWDEIENAWLESQLSNNFNISSLLTNNLGQINGKTYEFTWDPNKVNETTILLKNVDGNAVPDFTTKFGKEQREDAKEGLRTVLRGALDHTVTVSTSSDSPGFAPVRLAEEEADDLSLQDSIKMMTHLWGGDDAQLKVAVNHFVDQSSLVKDVKRTEDGIEVLYTDEFGELVQRSISYYVTEPNPEFDNTSPESSENPKEIRAQIENSEGELVDQRLTQEQYLQAIGPLLTGRSQITNALNRAKKEGIINPSQSLNTTGSASAAEVTEQGPMTYDREIFMYHEDQQKKNNERVFNLPGQGKEGGDIKGPLDFSDDEENVGAILQETYKDYGLRWKLMGKDKINIQIPGHPDGGLVLEGDLYNWQDKKRREQKEKLAAYIKAWINANANKFAEENGWIGEPKAKNKTGKFNG